MSIAPFPHRYAASATGRPDSHDDVTSPGVPALTMAPPEAFGGPGDRWSPETLLAAAVADCFVLTFRSVAAASKLPWTSLACDVEGTLDRVERTTLFTEFDIHATLDVPSEVDPAHAERLLEKAEHICLVTNSLRAEIRFAATVRVIE